jgi:signal transduction histidine kinase
MLNRFNTLFFRLSLILIVSILFSFLISNSLWWYFISKEESKSTKYEIEYLAAEVHHHVDQFNQLTHSQRQLIVNTLNRMSGTSYGFGGIHYLTLDKPLMTVDPLAQYTESMTLLSDMLAGVVQQLVNITVVEIDEKLSALFYGYQGDFSSEIENSDAFLEEYDTNQITLLESLLVVESDFPEYGVLIQAQLDDGQWLSMYTTAFSEHTRFSDILSPLYMIIIVCSLPLILFFLFIAIRWINHPLEKLVKKADAIGKNILLKQNKTIQGPKEIKNIESALLNMQDRIVEQIENNSSVFTAMSHDLKTPLTRLRIRAEMLSDQTHKQKMITDIERLEKMVTSALNYTKNTEATEKKHPIDLNALFQSITDDMADLGREVVVSGECHKPFLGYPMALRSCFTNLIENAVFYGDMADVTIHSTENALTVTIKDNGSGISEAHLDKVLTPYYRIDESRNLNTGGSGLGLSIVKKAVQAHMGSINLSNQKNKQGLKVQVTLPFTQST